MKLWIVDIGSRWDGGEFLIIAASTRQQAFDKLLLSGRNCSPPYGTKIDEILEVEFDENGVSTKVYE